MDIVCYMHLIYKGIISRSKISKIKTTNDFITFLFNPHSFNYDLFDLKWLNLKNFNLNDFLQEFSKSDDFYKLLCKCLKEQENPNKDIVDIFIKVSNSFSFSFLNAALLNT